MKLNNLWWTERGRNITGHNSVIFKFYSSYFQLGHPHPLVLFYCSK